MLLEGGLLQISHLITLRRINYLYTLLKMENSSLAKQVFQEQLKKKHKHDWATLVLQNLHEFGIKLSLEEIERLSKNTFKKIAKKACYNSAYTYLIQEKNKLSKGKNLIYNSLKTQNYLMPGTGLSTQDLKQIYSVRTETCFLKQISLECLVMTNV